MKTGDGIGSSIDPWSMPLVTGLQLGFMQLVPALSAEQFSQFSVHFPVHLSSPYCQYVYENANEDSVETLAKVKISSSHCFPLFILL